MVERIIRVSASGLRDFARCERLHYYRRVLDLQPIRLEESLEKGKLIHEAMEYAYSDRDWREPVKKAKTQFAELFEEERVRLGDIPGDSERILRSYFFHYRNEDKEWETLLDSDGVPIIEREFKARIPDTPVVLSGRIDRAARHIPTDTIWVWDHKSHKGAEVPLSEVKLGDIATTIYHVILRSLILKGKVEVAGVLFNYVRSKAPVIPTVLKSGKGLSRAKNIDTDPYTFLRACKKYGFDPKDYREALKRLKKRPRFSRVRVPKSSQLTKTILFEITMRALRIMDTTYFTRTLQDWTCNGCSFNPLCMAELLGQDYQYILTSLYEKRRKPEDGEEEEN